MLNIYKAKIKKYDAVKVQGRYYEAKRLQQLLKQLKKSKKEIEIEVDDQDRLAITFDSGQYTFNQLPHAQEISEEVIEVVTHEIKYDPGYRKTINGSKRRQANLVGSVHPRALKFN